MTLMHGLEQDKVQINLNRRTWQYWKIRRDWIASLIIIRPSCTVQSTKLKER